MFEPDGITCSESNVNLKDKDNEVKFRSIANQDILQKTIENANNPINNISVTTIDSKEVTGFVRQAVYSESLGNEWVLADTNKYYTYTHSGLVDREKLKNIDCIYMDSNIGILVLVEITKVIYNDNSYEIHQKLVTKENIRKLTT